MPFFILSLIVQVALVIHIMKTGRNTTWIWVVMMLPGAGSIAYFVMEILPELMGSRTARKASKSVGQVINPNKDINLAAQDYSITDTVENTLKLAEECVNKGMYQEAKTLYEKALSGIHADDPDIMVGLANTEYLLENPSVAKQLLNQLIATHPDYKNQEAHLLFAKSLEALGETPQALEEYEVLAGYYSGAEAKYRYATLLRKQGDTESADDMLAEILKLAKISGKHFRTLNKEWINLAKKELQR